MFGGHIWELVIVLVLALVFVGPGKLPEVGGAIGRGIREFRKASTDLENTLKGEPEPAPPPPPAPPQVEAPVQYAQSATPSQQSQPAEPAPAASAPAPAADHSGAPKTS